MQPFFDSHFHIQNLTHPQLEAFIDRLRNDSKIVRLLLQPIDQGMIDRVIGLAAVTAPIAGPLLAVIGPVAGFVRLVNRIFDRGEEEQPTMAHLYIINLLLLMNRPIDIYLQEVDDEIAAMKNPEMDTLRIGNQRFDKLVVSGLIMDYTDRDYTQSNFFKMFAYARKTKPVVRQTEDLLAGMKRYNESHPNDPNIVVLPFLGMNPENYGHRYHPPFQTALSANLDQFSLPDEWRSPPNQRMMYLPSNRSFVWYDSSMTSHDLSLLMDAVDNDAPYEDQAMSKEKLTSLFYYVNQDVAVNEVYLTDRPLLDLSVASKCRISNCDKGCTLEWMDTNMTIQEKRMLIDALPLPEDSPRSRSARAYNVGRVEFLFRQFDQNHPEGEGQPTLEDVLHQFFGDHAASYAEIEANQTAWNGNLNDVGPGVFLGIKLYPPLGFDPWPNGRQEENARKARVRYLYDFCQQREIPITVHTSDGGYKIMDDEMHEQYTSPRRWLPVLQAYPKLRINFAHCGVQGADMSGKHEWKKTLFEDILCAMEKPSDMDNLEFEDMLNSPETMPEQIEWKHPNVYSDLSDLLNTKEAYEEFEKGMSALDLKPVQWKHLKSRLLFGSDFMINLRESLSYTEYVSQFTVNHKEVWPDDDSPIKLSDQVLRLKMCTTNPMRFHFGSENL